MGKDDIKTLTREDFILEAENLTKVASASLENLYEHLFSDFSLDQSEPKAIVFYLFLPLIRSKLNEVEGELKNKSTLKGSTISSLIQDLTGLDKMIAAANSGIEEGYEYEQLVKVLLPWAEDSFSKQDVGLLRNFLSEYRYVHSGVLTAQKKGGKLDIPALIRKTIDLLNLPSGHPLLTLLSSRA